MSCRLAPENHAPETKPLVLRQAREGGAALTAEVSAHLAQMERAWEQRAREAHAAGVREGEAAGRSRAAAELQPVLDRLARSIEELAGMRARLRREAEAGLIQLALAIARRVLRREVMVDPEALHGLVLAALEKLQSQEKCRVRVHPSHAAALAARLGEAGGRGIEVAPDAGCEPGALIFETERGNLDASVESQLREIERGLTDRLRRRA